MILITFWNKNNILLKLFNLNFLSLFFKEVINKMLNLSRLDEILIQHNFIPTITKY